MTLDKILKIDFVVSLNDLRSARVAELAANFKQLVLDDALYLFLVGKDSAKLDNLGFKLGKPFLDLLSFKTGETAELPFWKPSRTQRAWSPFPSAATGALPCP